MARYGPGIEARQVEIYSLELMDFAPSAYPEMVFRTVCSTGTYIRTLADDIAAALGGRAHLSALRRLRNGSLQVNNAVTIADIEAAAAEDRATDLMLSPRDGLPDLAEAMVGDDLAMGIVNGLAFPVAAFSGEMPETGPVRMIDSAGDLLAVYRVDKGKARPEVVIS